MKTKMLSNGNTTMHTNAWNRLTNNCVSECTQTCPPAPRKWTSDGPTRCNDSDFGSECALVSRYKTANAKDETKTTAAMRTRSFRFDNADRAPFCRWTKRRRCFVDCAERSIVLVLLACLISSFGCWRVLSDIVIESSQHDLLRIDSQCGWWCRIITCLKL